LTSSTSASRAPSPASTPAATASSRPTPCTPWRWRCATLAPTCAA
jgi:hypothetical protein